MKKIRLTAALAAAVVLSFSCATGPYVQKEDKIQKLVELINRGGVNEIKGLSEAPFLFDAEPVLMQKDVAAVWDNFRNAGFALKNAKVLEVSRPEGNAYKAFGDSMEVKTFFKKYLNKDASLVKLGSEGGVYYLLLNKEAEGYPRIQGFKGPVK